MTRRTLHAAIRFGLTLVAACSGLDDRSPDIAMPAPGAPMGSVLGAPGSGDGTGGSAADDRSMTTPPAANAGAVVPGGAGVTFAFDPAPQSGVVGRPLARIAARLVDAAGTPLTQDGVRVSVSLRSD